ncbi:CLUMA_CG008954, isoform A [Clunio marinus]|uniref:CLUMA_CG008954, isoform A n=1 Tax=Clunio marinus TaxID=568069 RepID=A0A1J1I5C1_9DIPT|nr:CLUMA_CG008954, isoform A [Clunio marinus]
MFNVIRNITMDEPNNEMEKMEIYELVISNQILIDKIVTLRKQLREEHLEYKNLKQQSMQQKLSHQMPDQRNLNNDAKKKQILHYILTLQTKEQEILNLQNEIKTSEQEHDKLNRVNQFLREQLEKTSVQNNLLERIEKVEKELKSLKS